MLLACKKFPKTKITREQKKNIFQLKNSETKIVGDALVLSFYYTNKEQKLIVMYLEPIFVGTKAE